MRIEPVEPKGLGVELVKLNLEASKLNGGFVSRADDFAEFVNEFRKKIERFGEMVRGELKFEIDDKTHMVIVKIKDKETGEVIRQIPPEVAVKLAKAIDEFLGMIFDERA